MADLEKNNDLVLITRPIQESRVTARQIEASGFGTFIEPLLSIKHLNVKIPPLDDYAALIFTSVQAVRALGNQNIPVYTVGDKTARRARQAGYKNVISAGGNADDLIDLLKQENMPKDSKLLYLSGYDIAKEINVDNLIVTRLPLYQAEQVDAFSAELLSLLHQHKLRYVLFYSVRTALCFNDLVKKHECTPALKSIKALCISDSVVKSLKDLPWKDVQCAKSPNNDALIALLQQNRGDKDMADRNNQKALENATEIIERFGGIRPMAKKMSVAVTTVQGWKKRDIIPANRRSAVLEAAENNEIDLSDLIGSAANQNSNKTQSKPEAPASFSQQIRHVQPKAPVHEPAYETAQETISQATAQQPQRDNRNDTIISQIKESQGKAVEQSTWIMAAMLVIVIVLGGLLLAPTQKEISNQLNKNTQRIELAEQNIQSVDAEQKLLRTLIPANIENRFSDLQVQAKQVQQQIDGFRTEAAKFSANVLSTNAGSFDQRITNLEKQVNELTGGSSQLSNLVSRVRDLQQSVDGQTQLAASMQELKNMVTGLQGRTENLDQALQDVREQAGSALGETLGDVSQDDLKAAALLLGFTQFRTALNRNQPFEEDLVLLQNMLGEDNPELQQAITALAPKAKSGVLSPSGLSNQFKGLAGDIVVSSLKGEDISVQEKAKARLGEVLKIEKDGELITGTDTQSTVARAQKLLDAGNVEGAIIELQTLQGPAAQTAQPWINEAQMTLLSEKVEQLLGSKILGGLQGMNGASANPDQIINRIQKMMPRKGVISDEESGMAILPQ